MVSNLKHGFKPENLFPYYTWFLAPVVLLAGAFLVQSWRRLSEPCFLFLAYAAGTYLSVAMPGRFFPHYYQLWLPVLCIGGGWGAVLLGRWIKNFSKILAPVPALVCAALLLIHEVPNYALDGDQRSYQKYRSDRFTETVLLGKAVSRALGPGQTFYVLGNETGLYFYGKISPAFGLVFISPTVEGPLASGLTGRLRGFFRA